RPLQRPGGVWAHVRVHVRGLRRITRADEGLEDVRAGVEGADVGAAADVRRLAGLPQVVDVLLLDVGQQRVEQVAVRVRARAPGAGVVLVPDAGERTEVGREVV